MAVAVARGGGLGRLMGNLLGRSSLGGVGSPFESFGPLAAARRRDQAARAGDHGLGGLIGGLGRAAVFTVEEARRRMADFLSGAFRPASRAQFASYLASRLLGLERRSYGGRSSTHLVDALTNQSVPASAVDSRRLNDRALARALGRDPSAQRREAAEAAAAMACNSRLAAMLRDERPFRDWKDLEFSLSGMRKLRNRAYVVGAMEDGTDFRAAPVGGPAGGAPGGAAAQGYVGIKVGDCAPTREETLASIERIRAAIERRHGVRPTFVYDPGMRVGTPILIADRNLVRAARIDPRLAADRLAADFGEAFAEHAERHARAMGAAPRRGGPGAAANVVDLEAFAARFARKKDAPAPGPAPAAAPAFGFGFGGSEALPRDLDPRHVVVQYGSGAPRVWHSRRQREVVGVPTPNLLPPGEYLKEDEFGMPLGKLRVDAGGGVTHLAMDGREHNLDGASFEPAPGSGRPRRWAVEGETFDRFQDFKARRDAIVAALAAEGRAAAPVDEGPRAGGFGYGA